jgi:hypothetical protein
MGNNESVFSTAVSMCYPGRDCATVQQTVLPGGFVLLYNKLCFLAVSILPQPAVSMDLSVTEQSVLPLGLNVSLKHLLSG